MCIQNLYSQVYVRKRRYVTAMYINRNRIRKIIDRGNSLSPSARSCAPPRAEIFLYIFPSPPYFRWWPPIRNHIDWIKPYLDWREYLRAGFASGHGPASGSRRVLEEIRRTVAWEREREGIGRAPVEGRRRDAARCAPDREGKGRTARHAHNQYEPWLCGISDACAPLRPNLQSSSYTSSVRISTRFFHRLLVFYACVGTHHGKRRKRLFLSFLRFLFLFRALLFYFARIRHETWHFFSSFIIAGIWEKIGGGGERRGGGGLDNFFSFPRLDLN